MTSNNQRDNKNIRSIAMALSIVLALLSFGFVRYGGLYFFLEERAEIYPVNQLKSQGGDENALIGAGILIFLLVAVVYALRRKSGLSPVDPIVLFMALLIQSVCLLLIEVGSFRHSVQVHNGWILLMWIAAFSSLWVMCVKMAWDVTLHCSKPFQ